MRNPNPTPTRVGHPGIGTASNIAIAVDAEINVLERRLDKLREIRRLGKRCSSAGWR